MSRYIDAEALGIGKADRNAFKIPEYADGWNSAIEIIANAPTADVVEVRHGEWTKSSPYNRFMNCSVCGFGQSHTTFKYCPECGAKMDGERREE